jgi:DNA polymerase I
MLARRKKCRPLPNGAGTIPLRKWRHYRPTVQADCRTDVEALERLLPALLPHIEYPHALVRGQFTRSVAQMETLGIPIDTDLLSQLKDRWEDIRTAMFEKAVAAYGVLEGTKLNHARLNAYLKMHCPAWPLTASRKGYATDATTRRDMVALYPFMATLDTALTLRSTLKTLKLPVGPDGRNRTPIWPFSTKTARCAPSTTKYVFGLPAWLRSLVRPEEGRALAYLVYSQEEPAIAAVLSGDIGMWEGYQIGGDLYLDFAKRVGAVPKDATKQSHGATRDIYVGDHIKVYGFDRRKMYSNLISPEEVYTPRA